MARQTFLVKAYNRIASCCHELVEPFMGRDVIPKFLMANIERLRANTEGIDINIERTEWQNKKDEERRDEISQSATTLLQMLKESEVEENIFRSKQPQHVRKVQRDRNHILFLKLAKLAGDRDVLHNEKHWRQWLQMGVPVTGAIPETLKWAEKIIELEKKTAAPPKRRKRPPGFMENKDHTRLWDEFEESGFGGAEEAFLDDGQATEEEKLEGKFMPRVKGEITYMFGVNQGKFELLPSGEIFFEKLRRIMDFRPLNKLVSCAEKLRLCGHSTLVTILQLLVAKQDQFCGVISGAKDCTHDVSGLYQTPFSECGFWLRLKFEKFAREMSSLFFIGKLDFRRWYNQWAVEDPAMNVGAIWDPRKKRYRFFNNPSLQFGSLWSIFYCVRLSDVLMRIGAVLFGVLMIIYIDDSILISNHLLPNEMALISLLYAVLGIEPSSGKEEAMISVSQDGALNITPLLSVLGLMYRRTHDGYKIFGDGTKLRRVQMRISEFIDELLTNADDNAKRSKLLKPENLEKLVGNLIWLVYYSGQRATLVWVAQLRTWSAPPFFWKNFKKSDARARLQTILKNLKTEIDNLEPLRIEKKRLDAPVVRSWTDASLEGKGQDQISGIGGLMETVQWQQADCFHEITKQAMKSTSKAYKLRIKTSDWDCMLARGEKHHVQVFEALAVLIQVRLFEETMKANRVIFFIDNIAVVYALLKAGMRNNLGRTIIYLILKDLQQVPVWNCLYIKSKFNLSDPLTRDDLLQDFLPSFEGEFKEEEIVNGVLEKIKEEIWNSAVFAQPDGSKEEETDAKDVATPRTREENARRKKTCIKDIAENSKKCSSGKYDSRTDRTKRQSEPEACCLETYGTPRKRRRQTRRTAEIKQRTQEKATTDRKVGGGFSSSSKSIVDGWSEDEPHASFHDVL